MDIYTTIVATLGKISYCKGGRRNSRATGAAGKTSPEDDPVLEGLSMFSIKSMIICYD